MELRADQLAGAIIDSLLKAAPYVAHSDDCADSSGRACSCGFNGWALEARDRLEAVGALTDDSESLLDASRIALAIAKMPEEESKKLIDLLRDELDAQQADDDFEAQVNAEDAALDAHDAEELEKEEE